VLRSGRFGIGVLAAFLLGGEVEVSTRNAAADANAGITFRATLDTEEIELRRCSRPVGTTIRVRIDEGSAVWESLLKEPPRGWSDERAKITVGEKWDWYCLGEPTVERGVRLGMMSRGLSQQFSLPSPKAQLGPKWRRIMHEDYSDIQWSYWEGPFLACNGIVVMKDDPAPYRRSILGGIGSCEMVWPRVSVFDPDGHLPLVLQRNSLATDGYPFEHQLFQDVVRDLLAYLLVRGPRCRLNLPADAYFQWYTGVSYLSQRNSPSFHLCSAPEGLYPADEWHIKQGDFHKFLLLGGLTLHPNASPIPTEGDGRTLHIPVPNPEGTQRYRDWNRFALCGAAYSQGFGYLREFAVACRRMLLPRDEYETVRKGKVISKYWWSDVREESSNKEWVVVRTGDCDCGGNLDLLDLARSIERTPWPILIEWHLADSQSEPKDLTPLAALWRDLSLKSPVIPYDSGERLKRLPEAFDQLEEYIAAQNQLAADEENVKKEKKKQPSIQFSDDETDNANNS
jgi:molecular chaperone HtpG